MSKSGGTAEPFFVLYWDGEGFFVCAGSDDSVCQDVKTEIEKGLKKDGNNTGQAEGRLKKILSQGDYSGEYRGRHKQRTC